VIFVHKGAPTNGQPQTVDRPHPGPQSGPATAPSRWHLGRLLRFTIGASLLGLPIWFLMPGHWTISSTQAVVNAHVITLTSPIEGVVTLSPPPLGQPVAQGSVLLQIDSPMVNQGNIEELKTEVASLVGRVAALQQHRAKTEALKSELLISFNNYKDSMVRRVAHELEEARSEAEAANAALRQRVSEEDEEEARSRRGLGSQRELKLARFTAEIASKNAARASTAVTRLSDQLESIKRGVFTGPGDSRNDVPYSQQRIHELTVQQLDDDARIQENQARITQLERQIESETSRAKTRSSYQLKAPIDGIVWRHFVAQDSSVGPQTRLLQIIITSSVFIDATLNEKYADDIRPGDKVMVRLIGSDIEAPGTVKYILGADVLGEDETLATEAPKASRHEVHVIIDFDKALSGADDFNQSFVGRRAEIRFPGIARSVLRMR
jgi:multidrug resistance efflux pump